ncbi:hypothetical protein BX666DRAFT_1253738 [Dichotomocladium elegans]|nr:hypothetical protein BX666DRAFT_1253738 [Dichotomocladium elegans]
MRRAEQQGRVKVTAEPLSNMPAICPLSPLLNHRLTIQPFAYGLTYARRKYLLFGYMTKGTRPHSFMWYLTTSHMDTLPSKFIRLSSHPTQCVPDWIQRINACRNWRLVMHLPSRICGSTSMLTVRMHLILASSGIPLSTICQDTGHVTASGVVCRTLTRFDDITILTVYSNLMHFCLLIHLY